MNYNEAIEYIENGNGSIIKLGLTRIEKLMEYLGNPQNDLKIIHIAGTNGKGSSCAMISNILICAGYKVGVYTSPHLEKYNERYSINNENISDEKFVYYVTKIKEVCDIMEKTDFGRPTVFEILTAISFCYFKDENVDFVILEVGLGGRFDATNVVNNPFLTGITSISLDHTDYLGDTIDKIAFEKGGIIKENCPVVLYSQNKIVYDVIKKIADDKNSEVYFSENSGVEINKSDLEKTIFSVKNLYINYENIEIHMLGEYQPFNCAFVLMMCYALVKKGINISEKNIRDGLLNSKWNGRMEICQKSPLIIIDGAHNVDGIKMLRNSIEKYFNNKNITLVLGVLGDKEYEKMTELIMPIVNKVVLTEPYSQRKLDVLQLEKTVEKYNKILYKEKNIEKAILLAKSITEYDDVIVCSGSLYMIGEIRKILK